MSTRHKWYKEIQAWSEGAEIEFYHSSYARWVEAPSNPDWSGSIKYRIKPQPVEVIAGQPFKFKKKKYLYAYIDTRFGKIAFSTEWDKNSEMPLIGKIEVQDD